MRWQKVKGRFASNRKRIGAKIPTLVLDGDSRGAVKAHADLDAAVKRTTREYSDAGREAQNLEKAAKRIVEENLSPLERMQAKLKEVANAYAMGKISADEQAKAIQRIEQGFLGAGNAHKSAFGSDAVQQLASYAAGAISIGKAVQFVTNALQAQREEKERAAGNVAGGLTGAGELANVSPTQSAFTANIAVARQLMDRGIVPSDQQDMAMHAAAGIAASGATGGDQQFLLGLAAQRRIGAGQIGEFAQNVARTQQAFGPSAGSFQGISKQFIAAGSDTLGMSSPSDIGRYLADVAPEAADAGMSPSEALAAFVTYARQTKSPKAAEALLKQQIAEGNTPGGEGGAFYSQEVTKLQGAPSGAIPDYLASDPLLNTSRGVAKSKGSRNRQFEDLTTERTNLFSRLWEEEAKQVDAQYGTGVGGAVEKGRLNTANWLARTLGREDSYLSEYSSDDPNVIAAQKRSGRITSDELPADLLKDIRDYSRRHAEAAERGDRALPPPSGLQE